jgi:hypothetical protein
MTFQLYCIPTLPTTAADRIFVLVLPSTWHTKADFIKRIKELAPNDEL